jgi:uncharacterized protein (DUF302 family)
MNRISKAAIAFLLVGIIACSPKAEQPEIEVKENIKQQVDDLHNELMSIVDEKSIVAIVNHHELAKAEGVYTPPAVLTIFSDAKTNTPLIKQDQLLGLDLPYKILAFAEADTVNAQLAYTDVVFIGERHSFDLDALSAYQQQMDEILLQFDEGVISNSNLDSVNESFGLVHIQSDFGYQETVDRIKNIVNAQPDTKWFGEVDYSADAHALGDSVAPTTLLLFGGPKPGAMAMQTTPKIGLDAFCQKLLVYENVLGETWIAYNDIVAFSQLYYGEFTKPQAGINQRLMATFTIAIKNSEE